MGYCVGLYLIYGWMWCEFNSSEVHISSNEMSQYIVLHFICSNNIFLVFFLSLRILEGRSCGGKEVARTNCRINKATTSWYAS